MKILTIILAILALDLSNPITKIARINALKQEALNSYQQKNYDKAIQANQTLLSEFKVKEDKVKLNLAHAYFQKGKTQEAANYYQQLLQSPQNSLKSIAQQQLGILAYQEEDQETALNYFKQALKADPTNEQARYNYEFLKKDMQNQGGGSQQKGGKGKQGEEEQKNNDPNQENIPNEEQDGKESQKEKKKTKSKDGKQQESMQSGELENKDKPSSEKLEEINMSEEKAKELLDAMKNSEIQYLQQMRKSTQTTPDKTKPDW